MSSDEDEGRVVEADDFWMLEGSHGCPGCGRPFDDKVSQNDILTCHHCDEEWEFVVTYRKQ